LDPQNVPALFWSTNGALRLAGIRNYRRRSDPGVGHQHEKLEFATVADCTLESAAENSLLRQKQLPLLADEAAGLFGHQGKHPWKLHLNIDGILNHVEMPGDRLPESNDPEIHAVTVPALLQRRQGRAELSMNFAHSSLKPARRFGLAEVVRDRNDQWSGHARLHHPERQQHSDRFRSGGSARMS
jgi:hypothetical protein